MLDAWVKEWMREGSLPAPEDNPGMCLWGQDTDWDLFCELCGYSASEIASESEANRIAAKHLHELHPSPDR